MFVFWSYSVDEVCVPDCSSEFDWKPWAMADIPSKKFRTQLKLDLFMKSHSEQS